MSMRILNKLLRGLGLFLDETTRGKLYNDLKRDFSLIGSIEKEECEHLESMLNDPYLRKRIEEYIKAWLKKWSKAIDREESRKEKMEIYA